MSIYSGIQWFFGAKRRLFELQMDIELALDPSLSEDQRRENIGRVIQKHDPERWAQIQRECSGNGT
jgi:hypothetical protein